MIGPRYWSTGISLRWWPWHPGGSRRLPEARWSLKLTFHDDGFCELDSTEGELRLRYVTPDLEVALDLLVADAERLGIEWKDPTVYMEGDGVAVKDEFDRPYDYPPDWREIVNAQAARLGWKGYPE